MKIRTWAFFTGQAFSSMRRNSWMTIASIGTVAVTMIVLGIFLLLGGNINNFAGNIESQVEISLYLQDEITSRQVDELAQKLTAMEQVALVKYVSKEEALIELREMYGESGDFLAGLELDNPLRNGFRLRTHRPEQVLEIVPTLRTLDGVAEVQYGQGFVEQLFAVTNVLRVVALGLMLGLAAAATFIIANTIRITVFARRREISIMKYVGATDWFIRWPFVIEGMTLGLIGSLIAAGLVAWAYNAAVVNLAVTIPFFPLVKPWPFLLGIAGWVVLIGTAIGVIGSTVSLRRFLRV
ncbi:MAG TPA: ABC transporter permease [Firmicutes bacterium]|jgi:cell division transport system permease protein|nr:ABC transporter permease [Bacillota bacterium]